MNLFFRAFLSVCTVCFMAIGTSCGDDGPESYEKVPFTISGWQAGTDLCFEANGETRTLTLNDVDDIQSITVSIDYDDPAETDWLTATLAADLQAENRMSLTLVADLNYATSQRRAEVFIRSGRYEVRMPVMQLRAYEIEMPDVITLSAEMQTVDVRIKAMGVDTEFSTTADWLTVNDVRRDGAEVVVTLSVSGNTGTGRVAELICDYDDRVSPASVGVRQEPKAFGENAIITGLEPGQLEVALGVSIKKDAQGWESGPALVAALKNLTLSGRINGRDLLCLREIIKSGYVTSLSLDLEKAAIVSGYESYYPAFAPDMKKDAVLSLGANLPDFADNEMPELIFGEKISGTVIQPGRPTFNLTAIVLPETLTVIGDAAFSKSAIAEIVIPKGVERIGSRAFYCCSALTQVEIGVASSLTALGAEALLHTGELESLTLPAGLSDIAVNAISGVTKEGLHVGWTTPPSVEISEEASQCKLFVPSGSVSAYRANAYWNRFGTIIEE